MHTDMLCCVIAETAHTHLDELVHKLHVVFLELRILGVYVRKTADALMCALCSVVIVVDALKTMSVEHLVTAADCCIKLISHKVDVKCGMVRKNVHKHADAILLGLVQHDLHLFFSSDNVISDRPVGRLIVMVPVAFLLVKDLDSTSFRAEACIDRGCLDHGESGISDLLHVLRDGREVPAPYMEDGLCIGIVRIMDHTVNRLCSLLLGRLFRRRCACHDTQACDDVKNSFHIVNHA